MARELRKQEVADAVKAYAVSKGLEVSTNDKGGFCLMPGDILIECSEGKLICANAGVQMAIAELIMEMPQEPKATRSPENKAIMPPQARKSQGEALASPGSTLTLAKVREYFCKTATDEECAFALEVCQIRGLNPFKADCYLVKYGGANPKLEILVSNSFLLKRAMANSDFEYFKAGATVQKGETITDERREYAYPGETLLGGWAEIKRRSISVPFYVSIPLAGNKKESHFWKDTPGHMIRKTASSQVCREAFPEELAGLYDMDEMGMDPSKEVVV